MSNESLVICGLCGKKFTPEMGFRLARRSKTVATVDGWDCFGISPVFFACSYLHYEVLLANWTIKCREEARQQLGDIFEIDDPSRRLDETTRE